MTDTGKSLDAKSEQEQEQIVELSSLEQVTLQQLLLADKAERSQKLKEIILATVDKQDLYRLGSLWSKAFQCQELYQLGPGLFWQHYPDVSMLLSAKWHQKQQKEHPLEWIPLAKMLSSKTPPMCHMSDKLIDSIKNCKIMQGQYIVLISVQPIGIFRDRVLPPILDVLIRQRTPRDDIGPIPGFRRYVYKCAVCEYTGDGREEHRGVPPLQPLPAERPRYGIPKPLVPCPYCHTTYYCSSEHLVQHKTVHSSECCTKTIQETLQDKLNVYIKKHEEEFAKDNFYDLKHFVKLYGEDVVMKWYRQVNTVESDYGDNPQDQEDPEEESTIDFGLVPDDVAADMKKMIRKIDREKRQAKAKSKATTTVKTEAKIQANTQKKIKPKINTLGNKTGTVVDMDTDTDVENDHGTKSKSGSAKVEKKQLQQTSTSIGISKPKQEFKAKVIKTKPKKSSATTIATTETKTPSKKAPSKKSENEPMPMDVDKKTKVTPRTTTATRRASSRAKPEPMLKSTLD